MIVTPLLAPTVNDTFTAPVDVVVEPDTAVTAVGGAGEPSVTGKDGADTRPAPREFVAFAVHA